MVGKWSVSSLINFQNNLILFISSHLPTNEESFNFYSLKIDKTGINEKTSNEGIIAPFVFLILSSILCYGLADKIYA